MLGELEETGSYAFHSSSPHLTSARLCPWNSYLVASSIQFAVRTTAWSSGLCIVLGTRNTWGSDPDSTTAWPWVSHFPFMCLSFPICEIGQIILVGRAEGMLPFLLQEEVNGPSWLPLHDASCFPFLSWVGQRKPDDQLFVLKTLRINPPCPTPPQMLWAVSNLPTAMPLCFQH